jgi:hypothetical protein
MIRRRAIGLLCCLFAAGNFFCSPDSPQIVNNGGSEVVGKLVTVNNSPVNNARVFAYKAVPDTSVDSLPVDTVFTNAQGDYAFTSLELGRYNLRAMGKYGSDSLVAFHYGVIML